MYSKPPYGISAIRGLIYIFLHNSLDVMYAAVVHGRNDVAVNCLTVNSHGLDALLRACGVIDLDNVCRAAELSRYGEALHVVGDAGVYHKSLVVCTDAEDELGNVEERPGSGTGQPAVLSFAEVLSVLAGDHLRIDIRLGAMYLADVLDVCRADP